MKNQNEDLYEDILYLPHPVSRTHPQMPVRDRAAQFAPFAALNGHGDAIEETARLTGERHELDEDQKRILDEKLQLLREYVSQKPRITVTYFVPDAWKTGGAYESTSGCLLKIDEYRHVLVLENGLEIAIDEIAGMSGDVFRWLDGRTGAYTDVI
jgi:hypothetical protein